MRKLLFLGLLSFIAPALADTAPATTNANTSPVVLKTLKIGVVDVRTVVQKSPQLQAINTQLTQKFKPREKNIVDAQAKFKAEQEKYNKEAQNMKPEDRAKLEHQLITDRANLQAEITAFQQDLDNEQNAAMQQLLSQIASIVNDVAKTQGYDLILQGDNVPYVSDSLNLTNLVLQKLSAK
jgi:outer membrane protein